MDFSAVLFVLIALLGFSVVGKIDNLKSYIWFILLYSLFIFPPSPENFYVVLIFLLSSVGFLLYVNRGKDKDNIPSFSLNWKVYLKFTLSFLRVLFFNISYLLFLCCSYGLFYPGHCFIQV